MSKHTPGPWHADLSCNGLAVESAQHGNIGIVNLVRASKADARLIAAAPDLLALARQYASECAECGGEGSIAVSDDPVAAGLQMVCTACADIWAVIDKAEGRA